MSAHLVETSEEDSYLAVTRHVADLLNEGQVSRRLAPPINSGGFHLHHNSGGL